MPMPTRNTHGARNCKNSTACIDDHSLRLGVRTADVEIDIIIAQTSVAIDWQDMVWQHFFCRSFFALRLLVLHIGYNIKLSASPSKHAEEKGKYESDVAAMMLK